MDIKGAIPEELARRFSYLDDMRNRAWNGLTLTQAYGIYALGLLVNETDFASLAASSNTDGGNDKKIDLLHIDEQSGTATVGQVCVYDDWNRQAAEANKASDLAAALSWLLSADEQSVPEHLRAKAIELRQLIADKAITRVELLSVHNCPESKNVQSELATVAKGASAQLSGKCAVHYRELGYANIQDLFDSLEKDILITEVVPLDTGPQFPLAGDGWAAVVTTLNGTVLKTLYAKFGDRLFTSNIRGYLDIVRKKGNINKDIHDTVATDPDRFWTYNNGITILTTRLQQTGPAGLTLEGLSIINGAQTTGVVGNSEDDKVTHLQVPCRVVQCNDQEVVDKIIRFNNTQNAIKSFDLRSNDPIQNRLRTSLSGYSIEYVHRRTGLRRMPSSAIHADSMAPMLASFHDDFATATRNRADIFESDEKYQRVFPQTISAEHVFLVQCLSDAIDQVKRNLQEAEANETATEIQRDELRMMEFSTSKQFVINVIGQLAEQIVGGRVASRMAWKAKPSAVRPDRNALRAAWIIAIDQLLPLIYSEIRRDVYKGVRSAEEARRVAGAVRVLLESLRNQFQAGFSPLRDLTDW